MFWTDEKLGKHKAVKEQAADLYNKYALCGPTQLEQRLHESIFRFGDSAKLIEWKDILTFANLDDCLKPEYIQDALTKVNTVRPAIGKGEFIFASLFANVGFAKDAGDLVDLHTR